MLLRTCATALVLGLALQALGSAADELDSTRQVMRSAAAERVDRYLS